MAATASSMAARATGSRTGSTAVAFSGHTTNTSDSLCLEVRLSASAVVASTWLLVTAR
jgi:hypothetical protein